MKYRHPQKASYHILLARDNPNLEAIPNIDVYRITNLREERRDFSDAFQ